MDPANNESQSRHSMSHVLWLVPKKTTRRGGTHGGGLGLPRSVLETKQDVGRKLVEPTLVAEFPDRIQLAEICVVFA